MPYLGASSPLSKNTFEIDHTSYFLMRSVKALMALLTCFSSVSVMFIMSCCSKSRNAIPTSASVSELMLSFATAFCLSSRSVSLGSRNASSRRSIVETVGTHSSRSIRPMWVLLIPVHHDSSSCVQPFLNRYSWIVFPKVFPFSDFGCMSFSSNLIFFLSFMIFIYFKTAQDSSKLFIIFHAYLAMYAKIQFMPTNPFFKKFQIFLSTRQSEEILGTDNSRQKFPAFWGRSRSPLIPESFLPDGTLSSRLPASRSFPFDWRISRTFGG